ncbi:Eco57I restriction-modification methylase domain-containing protein [Paracoccus saliphilus]|uniref:site-specific DNA-methyltransferase (adenine-specific) n=1 Tax=Paracoccus saliphilus TaxID=405559 RepID=A0AA46A6Q8_9RHOB|nr:N-6 DNA methylase [Paracoccus saliphilus]WCR04392.1 N-6 DNA methylase [Paracoccus saliphilus]SIT01985.1 N-6 DNA Methylase [Paracoccus saliphilus]
MARKPITDMSAWPSLSLEGNLIAPAMIAKIDQRQAPEQSPEEYGVRKGLQIREEIATAFRVGQSHFDAFAKIEPPSVAATSRFFADFFKETFGYTDLAVAAAPIALTASDRVPVVVVPPSELLDRRSPTLSTDRSRSPAFALQDHLNDRDEALWGIVTNGMQLRLMRDNASLTRPAYIEADLAQMFTNEDIASFAVLWLLIHRTRFGAADTPATDCPLERWRDAGSKEGEAARDRLADQVQLALKLLGSGFLEANPDLAAKLRSGEVNLTEWFNELLRLVYRLIFLMVAEDRNLLHPEKAKPKARALYAQGYSFQSLREQCYRAATWDKHHDRYEGVKIVFRALTHGQPVLALPALGGLFAEDRLPHLETARLRNRAFMEALYRLSWLADKNGMVPVNWRAMETEELGSVYESLLELQPQLGDDGRTLVFASEAAEQKGNQRKTTGSYYTPDNLVQALLDTALDPVLDKTEAEADDPEQALLKLSVIDPACGSGHFLLAAARRIATRLARIRAEGTPSLADFRHALRDVARCCIYGVDRNPMAVELTKVALWIETVDPGLPLGFFDAQIRCGDSLLGVFELKVLEDGIPDAAYKPLTGDDKDTARYYLQANRAATSGQGGFDFGTGQVAMPEMKPLALDFSGFRDLPEDTVEQIGAKAVRFKELRKGQAFVRATAAANLYVAAFLLPKVGGAPTGSSTRTVPTTEELWMALNQGKLRQAMVDAPKAARRARAFHWPLEFPDVMQRGGFDVVLGNPPWEVMQLSDKEYFALRNPEIAELTGAKRKKAIEALAHTDPNAYSEYQFEKRLSSAANDFAREATHFSLVSKGKVNTFSLFAALALALTGRNGWSGIILPAEILTSETLSDFLKNLVDSKLLKTAFAFENEEFAFPGIANVVRFCLLTFSRDQGEDSKIEMAHFLRQVAQLGDQERIVGLSPGDFVTFTPSLGTSPIFRSRHDFELSNQLFSSLPRMGGKTDGYWELEAKQGLFNMTSSSSLFHEKGELEGHGLMLTRGMEFEGKGTNFVPLYEGKFISHFDHRFSSYHNLGKEKGRGGRGLPPVKIEEYQDPSFEVLPRYWVETSDVRDVLESFDWHRRWMIAWRDIANAKVERTTTFSVIPWSAVGDTASLLFPHHQPSECAYLLANLNSLVLDYCARQIVGGTHMTIGYLRQLPVLGPDFYTEERAEFVKSRTLELTYTSNSVAPFARDLGHDGPPFAWDEDRRAHLRAELDAFYARAYGLTRDELRYILDPADVKGPDYPSETFRVLKEKEIRQHGEYRTRRLVLEVWDRMEQDGTFAALGMADGTSAVAQQIELSPLNQYQDAVWAWPQGVNERDRVRAQLRAMVGILPGPSDARRVRLAALACLQPGLLDGFLTEADRREWQRLMAHSTGVTQLVPPTNSAWGAAFNAHYSSAVLDVSSDGTRWSAGPTLDRSTLNASDPYVGRAIFAWSRLEGVDLEHGLTQVSAEVLPFIREGSLAA